MPPASPIPSHMPLFPMPPGQILLPGVVARLTLPQSSHAHILNYLVNETKKLGGSKDPIYVSCFPLKKGVPPASQEVERGSLIRKPISSADILPYPDTTAPSEPGDLFHVGVVARVVSLSRRGSRRQEVSEALYTIVVEGMARIQLEKTVQQNGIWFTTVKVVDQPEPSTSDTELQAVILNLRQSANEFVTSLSQLQFSSTVLNQLRDMLGNTPTQLLPDLLASMMDTSFEEKLSLLETFDLKQRCVKVVELLKRQIQVLTISQQLQNTIDTKLGKRQREILLREQLEAIKKELGESDEGAEEDDVTELKKKMDGVGLPDEVKVAANKELKRMKRMNPALAEYQVIRSYLDLLFDMPWKKSSDDTLDIQHARHVLDQDHSGLDFVKTRIIEFLAVRKLKNDLRGPLLCLVGPPGVGKTSLGRSIAKALGRKYYRMSLGGVRDEAEIRGHRRTYVGALPGMIVQGLKRVNVNNPVFLLDEIDKLGKDVRGDPASALLEVLDPEQNATFVDHYMSLPFDLSKVMFIATANSLDTIPPPLLDRMEVIEIPGYTIDEKVAIARKHLWTKQVKNHGIPLDKVSIDEEALELIATKYTREAGVRSLERELAAICRSLSMDYADALEKGRQVLYDGKVDVRRVKKILGELKYDDDVAERTSIPGVVTGLAWTQSGSGGILFIEATKTPGKGNLHLTGKLGDVIKESARIAMTWVSANVELLGITSSSGTKDVFQDIDIHIHFPAGAVPKDGPSAGVAITCALLSLLLNEPILPYSALTGEMTLRGQVLPVGGIKEKVLAAHRGGIKRVLLPVRNQKDTSEIPYKVLTELELTFVNGIWDVLPILFPNRQEVFGKRLGGGSHGSIEPASVEQEKGDQSSPHPIASFKSRL